MKFGKLFYFELILSVILVPALRVYHSDYLKERMVGKINAIILSV